MKFIFLDEWVWIDIRKNILNENDAKDIRPVIDKIEEKSKSGEWVFPISAEHLSETQNTGDKLKRIVLGFLMDEVSHGYSILQFSKLKDFEIDMMLQGQYAENYRGDVIKQDMLNIWGGTSRELFEKACQEEGIEKNSHMYNLVWQIYSLHTANDHRIAMSMIEPELISEEIKEMHVKILDNLKQKDIAEPYISVEQFMMYTLEQYYSEEQQMRILSFFSDEIKKADKPNAKTLLNLFRKLPTYYTNCMLIYKNMKMQNVNKESHKNDFTDMLYLSYMIPYCDVVVTEKKWVNVAKQMKLEKEFNTLITADIKELLTFDNTN